MLRRTSFQPAHLLRFCLCASSTTSSNPLFFVSKRHCSSSSSSAGGSNGSSSPSLLSQLMVDPGIQAINAHLRQPPEDQPEVVVIVDGTALIYRLMFSFRSFVGSQNGQLLKKKSSTDASPEGKEEDTTASAPVTGLEMDPTGYLHNALPRFVEFAHTLVPLDYDPVTQKQSSSVLPAAVTAHALECGFLKPSGGPFLSSTQVEWMAKKKQMEKQRKAAALAAAQGGEEDAADHEQQEQEPQQQQRLNRSDPTARPMLAESPLSPGLLRRRVIFCFDHGREHVRSAHIAEYKGHRPRCGRFSSFVAYATALFRQMHSCSGVVHSVLPHSLGAVQHDGEFCLDGTPESARANAEMAEMAELRQQLVAEKFKQRQQQQQQMNKKTDAAVAGEEKQAGRKEDDDEEDVSDAEAAIQAKIRRLMRGDDEPLRSLLHGSTVTNPLNTPDSGEADDIIATCVRHFTDPANPRNKKRSVVVVTHDKDLLQLLHYPNTYFYNLGRSCYVTEDDVKREYGLPSAESIADYLTLYGDIADNVSGLPRTGSERARGLIQAYGSVEGLIEAARAAKPGDAPDFRVWGGTGKELEQRKKIAAAAAAAAAGGNASVPPAEEDGEHDLEEEDEISSTSNSNKKKERKRNPGLYEKNLFEQVRLNADRLLETKHKVIALLQVESCAKFLADADKAEGERLSTAPAATTTSASPPPETSTFFGPATFIHQFRRENVFAPGGVFRRRFGRPSQLSEQSTVDVWRGIRDYYTATHGACTPELEAVHRCGSFSLSPKARKLKRETDLLTRQTARAAVKAEERLEKKKKKAAAVSDRASASKTPKRLSSSAAAKKKKKKKNQSGGRK